MSLTVSEIFHHLWTRASGLAKYFIWTAFIGSSKSFGRSLFCLTALSLLMILLLIAVYRNNPTSGRETVGVSLLADFSLGQLEREMESGLLDAMTRGSNIIDNNNTNENNNNYANKILEPIYFRQITRNHAKCSHSRRIGDKSNGRWDLCMSTPFNPSVVGSRDGCIAFSFGINYVFEYDNILAGKEFNCTVRMFDPSMIKFSEKQIGNRKQWFYLKGLAGKTGTAAGTGWQMYTLCNLFNEFVEPGKPIDILKIDIDLWEWESFETALKDGCLKRVKQLLFETHTIMPKASDHPDYARYVRVWLGLLRAGFRMWNWHENLLSYKYLAANGTAKVPCCYEHYMLNWNFVH